jgi:hypothetical protein
MLCSTLEVKVFIIITKVLMIHHSYYHGYRKERTTEVPSQRTPSFQNYVEVYNYTHTEKIGWTSISHAPEIRIASCLQPFPNPAQVFNERSDWVPDQCSIHSRPTPHPLLVLGINRSQLVTWLVDPIRDMWSVQVVTRTYISQYTVLTTPRAMSSEIPHSWQRTPHMSRISKLSSRLPY